eukprot:CAMPEP_0169273346 /NCGR_PEP_ID=MMETSP1016-20121227/51047_1 /TAXON_ID=342587 /ORGANISM="Karlodinium micrum, Strain CCMP2283" /LENGTH=43 /DNA_ID= /DNA_START= /DNA_END= /DNA_ORIENTATION=
MQLAQISQCLHDIEIRARPTATFMVPSTILQLYSCEAAAQEEG